MRDFVYVSDVAAANVRALTGDPPITGIFNIASGTPTTVHEMAEMLAAVVGRESLAPQITGAFRLGDVRHVMGSPQRAAHLLGWRAEIDIEVGIKDFASDPLREAPVTIQR
jgi:dTDP-L-rhamnose 4-epimerase